MGYCVVEDIKAYYLGKTFSSSDYLTDTKVEALIAGDYALINIKLKSKYSLPISDSNDLLFLKMINEMLTVGTIDDIFREKTEDGKFNRQRNTRKEALDLLDSLMDGTLVLDGSSKDSVIKFNLIDSNGNEVQKRFKDSNIEPYLTSRDLNNRTQVRS